MHSERGSQPRMPEFVMSVIEKGGIARPSFQAKYFGFAETHSGARRLVIQCALRVMSTRPAQADRNRDAMSAIRAGAIGDLDELHFPLAREAARS
jgi:hypothetical protein